MKRDIFIVVLGASFLALPTGASGQSVGYDVFDLFAGAPHPPASRAMVINGSGDVGGITVDAYGNPIEIVLWADGEVTFVTAQGRFPTGLSGDGMLVAQKQSPATTSWAVVDGQEICLPTPAWCLPQYLYAVKNVRGLNENGVFTGSFSPETDPDDWPPVLPGSDLMIGTIDENGQPQITYLGMFDGEKTFGYGINNAGDVVGKYGISPNFDAFLHRDGAFHQLPSLGFSYNWPLAINEFNLVAGFVGLPEQMLFTPIDTMGAVWNVADPSQVTLTTIGQLIDSTHSRLTDINDSGVAVGYAARYEEHQLIWLAPIIWSDETGIINVNDLLPAESGWHISSVESINNAGQIAATASLNGSSPRAVRLDPVESSGIIGDMTGDGTVGVEDLLMLLAAWGECHGHCPADMNSDGHVDVTDLMMLLANWG